MSSQSDYGFSTTLDLPLEEAITHTKAALKTEGFGVLTEIDVRATLWEKLGVEVPSHVILGACNPALAHQALQIEPEVGLLLPCNVTVRDEAGKIRVSIVDPDAMLGVVTNPAMRTIASDAKERLERVIAHLAAGTSKSGASRLGDNR